ncbi:hypothetical protein [Vibrio mexicanus]|uniref:hypothetical protein n=1 Tax=Vibrio mexicanus TaxID=1004326 RepID=UPI00063C7FC2|nr:hypothetical protein [Vibrio mexicanus]
MAEFETQGFEFYGESEQVFRMMLIERIETFMAHGKLSKNTLAEKAHIAKTAFYQKMDREATSQFTVIDLFRIAKVLDVSILQLMPVDEIDRKHGGQLPIPASSLHFLDQMLAAPKEEIELMSKLYNVYCEHKDENKSD